MGNEYLQLLQNALAAAASQQSTMPTSSEKHHSGGIPAPIPHPLLGQLRQTSSEQSTDTENMDVSGPPLSAGMHQNRQKREAIVTHLKILRFSWTFDSDCFRRGQFKCNDSGFFCSTKSSNFFWFWPNNFSTHSRSAEDYDCNKET